jgi:pimeloyl-ACP methyl ester carboxylesterase
LAGWLLWSRSPGDRAIVLVHGLDSSAWSNDKPVVARAYLEAGFDVLVFDLRGHGGSSGDRLGLGWDERRDVRAAVDLLLGRGFEPERIGIHGTSYGAAVSLLAAAAIPEIGAVVADSAFADMRDIMYAQIQSKTGVPSQFARLLGPGLALLAWFIYSLDFEVIPPENAVPDIEPRPILFIHGRQDAVIPVTHACRLIAESRNPADEIWLHHLGHTEGVLLQAEPCKVQDPSPLREAYLKKVTAFFERTLR